MSRASNILEMMNLPDDMSDDDMSKLYDDVMKDVTCECGECDECKKKNEGKQCECGECEECKKRTEEACKKKS